MKDAVPGGNFYVFPFGGKLALKFDGGVRLVGNGVGGEAAADGNDFFKGNFRNYLAVENSLFAVADREVGNLIVSDC